MSELEKAVVDWFLANEAFAAASFERSEEAGNQLMDAEDALLTIARTLAFGSNRAAEGI